MFQESFMGVSMKFLEYFKDVLRMFSFKGESGQFQGVFK